MQTYLALCALGPHRPNVIQALAKAIKDYGGNIAESRMALLGNEVSIMMLLTGSWDSIAKFETILPRLEETLDLTIVAKRTDPRKKPTNSIPYAIEVVALDRTGIVHDLTQFFATRNITIEDIYSGGYTASHTGAQMSSLHFTVSIPATTSIAGIRGEFTDFCDQLNLDAIMEPVK
jgi:glycine cleavage system transcriptional repressor